MKAMALAAGMALTGGDVHLDKPMDTVDPVRWQGVPVGDVADVAQIGRIIVLRAATSAPRELDLANLRRMLADSAGAPLQPVAKAPPWQPRDGIWHALLLMRSGQVLDLEIRAGGTGLQGCLASEDGARACFEVPPAS